MTRRRIDRQPGTGDQSESGFTLIEVVIAVVLLAMIMGALSAAFVTSMKLSASTTQHTKESNDAQLIAGFLVSDAQAAGATNAITGAIDLSYGISINGDAGCVIPGGASAVLRLEWRDRATVPASHDDVAVYYWVPPTGTLIGQSGHLVRQTCVDGTAITSTNILARNIPTKPSATCNPDCNETPSLPSTVSMTVSELQNTQPYTLTASTRPEGQTTTEETGTPAPLVLLGNDACSATAPLSGTANVPLKVFGNVFLEGGGGGCDAYTLDHYTTTGRTEAIDPARCPAGSTPTCTDIAGITHRDPYVGLTPPAQPGSAGTACSGPDDDSQTADAGTFNSGFSLLSGTCTLSSGTYFVKGDFTVAGGAALNTDGGTVLIYLESGQFSIGGKFSASADPTQNHGMVLWQAQGDNNPLTTVAGANVHLNGVVYAPSAVFSVAKRVAMKAFVGQALTFGTAPANDPSYDVSQIGLNNTPTETTMTPAVRDQAASDEPITIVGSHFANPTVSFGPGIAVTPVSATATQINVTISIDPTATLGPRDVTITNADEGIDIEEGAFTVEPRPAVMSVTLANGAATNVVGTIEPGDTIRVVFRKQINGFAKQMSVQSLCTAWAGDNTAQSLNDATVTLVHGAGPPGDKLSVSSPTCPFNFGTIDLGTNGYTTGNETFGGAGPVPSTITWDPTTNTLLITLGSQASGTSLPVTASQPTYAPSNLIKDTRNGLVDPPTFLLPLNGPQF